MQILGIQIDFPYIRTALLFKSRKSLEIRVLKKILLSDLKDVKQLYTQNFKGWTASGISSKDLLIRTAHLKIASRRYLEKAIAFQSDATSHFDASEMVVVPSIQKKEDDSVQALLYTVPREALKNHLKDLAALQIDPDGISTTGSALCSFVRWKIPDLSSAFIVDLGPNEWSCVFMEKGVFKKSYSINGGTGFLFSALWEDRKKILLPGEIQGTAKQIDLLFLKPHLNPNFTIKLNEFRKELAKAIYSFHRDAGPQPLIFTGKTDAFGHFTEFLADSFKDAVTFPSVPLPLNELKFAIPLGLALEQALFRPLQFRVEEFFPQKNWMRAGLYSLFLIFLSLTAAGSFFWFGTQRIEAKKKEMAFAVQHWLDQWDPDLKKTLFSKNFDPENVIERWISEIDKNKKDYPYIPQMPKASEVLSWISAHPLLGQFQKEGDPIQIREIRYQLVSFPKIGALQDPYLGKVEIEFQFQEATHARKFHEILILGDEIVDPHLDISWEVLNDGYRTSFYLKNRSNHV